MTTATSCEVKQGGMGVGISGYRLSRGVSILGQGGTVSGTILERMLAIILQQGDPGGDMRRALAHFPFPEIAQDLIQKYYREGGTALGQAYKGIPAISVNPPQLLIALTICANFAFVWLAKEGHANPITINYLEKVSMPHLYAITGAMLAGVDAITMGAGVALQIPAVINDILDNKTASYRIPVIGDTIKSYLMTFSPSEFFGEKLSFKTKPLFLPIIASNLLGNIFMQKLPAGSVDGFVVEEWVAGGHNAPPRKTVLNEQGEKLPIYGEKDIVNYKQIADLGLPFWIAGARASPEMLRQALALGATGIQAGSIFALCDESGMDPARKARIRQLGYEGNLNVLTDMRVSPTGFPFKVAVLDGTISDKSVYETRTRICNVGALVSAYERPNGSIGYRCPSEPEEKFVAKGGDISETVGRGCICNGLSVTAGVGNPGEPAVVTMGDDTSFLRRLMADAQSSYSAKDAIDFLLGNQRN